MIRKVLAKKNKNNLQPTYIHISCPSFFNVAQNMADIFLDGLLLGKQAAQESFVSTFFGLELHAINHKSFCCILRLYFINLL